MARRKRENTNAAMSLSFLDVMSCGLGAVTLLFLIMKHNAEANVSVQPTPDFLPSEVRLLEEEIRRGQENLVRTRNTLSDVDEELAEAEGLADRIMEEKRETAALIEQLTKDVNSVELEALKSRIRQLELQKQQIEQQASKTGEDTRRIAGEGRRQYLTGLKLSGERHLILVDRSASMLDDRIVNVVRFKNMRDELKRNADKWRRTQRMVEWLVARLPAGSRYQVYTFSTDTKPALDGSLGQWLETRDAIKLKSVMDQLKAIVPEGGTNLEKAFASVRGLQPLPDNVYLITDGLPTLGAGAGSSTTVSAKERMRIFAEAIKALPTSVAVNVILAPLEGDPDAASAYWHLAQNTKGSFMSPSSDWP